MKFRALHAAALALLSVLAIGSPAAMAQGKSSISGMIYFDANANGRPEAHERAIRNLQVDLDGPDYHESRKTDEHGRYEFTELADGKYWISVKLPSGFGLSAGENRELTLEGYTRLERVDFGIARSEMLPTPTVAPTRPPPPTATKPPVVSVPQAPAAPAVSSAPPPASSGAPRSFGAPGVARQAPPTNTPQPTPTSKPSPTPEPPPTAVPTPTRTPPPLDELQAAAERARAALAWPTAPHTGSTTSGNDMLLDVPFRNAHDGSDYADTNTGSASLAMALEAYGFKAETADLRALANVLSRNYDVGQPPRIDVLVRVAEQAGLRGIGLYQGIRLSVWTAEDVRERVRAGYPILTQIGSSEAYSDGKPEEQRYVLIIGLKDGAFLYHDPSYPDSRGARRTLPASSLSLAWSRGAGSAQAAALALGRAQLGLFASPDELVAAQQQPDVFANVREVPVVTSQPAQDGPSPARPLQQVEAEEMEEVSAEPSLPWGIPATHPLLVAFWAVTGVALLKVAAGLVFG